MTLTATVEIDRIGIPEPSEEHAFASEFAVSLADPNLPNPVNARDSIDRFRTVENLRDVIKLECDQSFMLSMTADGLREWGDDEFEAFNAAVDSGIDDLDLREVRNAFDDAGRPDFDKYAIILTIEFHDGASLAGAGESGPDSDRFTFEFATLGVRV